MANEQSRGALAAPERTEHPHIERVSGVCGGEPKIVGTRMAVWMIAEWCAQGASADEIAAMYPHLTAAQVHDALSYYYDHKEAIDAVRHENSEERWQPILGKK
jgi:uncharacterized protein (DUF433 family)